MSSFNGRQNHTCAISGGALSQKGVVLDMQDDRCTWGSSYHGQPSLFLYFIAALVLRHRRRIIDDCRDQAGLPPGP